MGAANDLAHRAMGTILASWLWFYAVAILLSLVREYYHLKMLALYDRSGPIVRTGPYTLSFNTAQGFKGVYGSRPGVAQFSRNPEIYGPMIPTRDSVGGPISNEADFIFNSVKGSAIVSAFHHFPALAMLQEALTPPLFRRQIMQNLTISAEKAERRVALGVDRVDFMSTMIKNGLVDDHPQAQEEEKVMRMSSRTDVHVPHYDSYMSGASFFRATDFLPERWLGTDPQFEGDKKDTLQPFSVGARNCPGKSLAYLEMRLTLAKLVYHFDMELCPVSEGWNDQYTYFLWHWHR
ncbi:cytochrome P450 [Aspergillus indologenus CBS 114.80]|uniref:Cytochrome P450 n=1 Tax=Aspergillus indologenus CBS 114.80 TaxID=1450541 RepID=A0A2V5JBU8_9EURO|nr:cytochrome P450 [Aspergillus indologenus CBS 114.80]